MMTIGCLARQRDDPPFYKRPTWPLPTSVEHLKLFESTVFETNAWFKVLVLISPSGEFPRLPGTTSAQNGYKIPALLYGHQELPPPWRITI